MKHLSPALLRVGGSSSDWLFFDRPQNVIDSLRLKPKANVMTSKMNLRSVLAAAEYICFHCEVAVLTGVELKLFYNLHIILHLHRYNTSSKYSLHHANYCTPNCCS